jgi:hypothetical protein
MEKHYDENYIIYSDGRVYSVRSKKFLKPFYNDKGYLKVDIYRKNYKVHRLVAELFIPNPNNFPEVNHKNEIKTDNRVENLEWCNRRYNINYSTKSNYPGVELRKNGRYRSKIYFKKKKINLGTFNTAEEAHQAYSTFLAQHNAL